jgi:Ca2+-binding EF-hand superfamily protein
MQAGAAAVASTQSRPASGDSNHSSSSRGYSGVAFTSFPEHSNPLFNDTLLRAKFEAYDVHRQGFISRSQLINFYRTHNSFAFDATDDDVMRALTADLAPLHRNFFDAAAEQEVSFDCFCAVALKLAKS